MTAFASEKDLARAVVQWLKADDWTVYQEVKTPVGAILDIVAAKPPIYWIIETKLTLSLDLIEQAAESVRRGLATFVSAAVPQARRSCFAHDILRSYGVGLLVAQRSGSRVFIRADVQPRVIRHSNVSRYSERWHVKNYVREEHITCCEAGGNRGGYLTPFKETCDDLRRFIRKNPGCTVKQAIDGITHHYRTDATARATLPKWIKAGKVKGVRLDDSQRPHRLVLEANP